MKVIIVGAGKLGRKLAELMVDDNIHVTVIEKDLERLDRIHEYLDVLTVQGNGMDMSLLKDLNIEEYDLLVACTTRDETNALICSLAENLGCKKTIARIRNPEYLEQVEFIKGELGIDYVINPDLATAEAMEKYLLKSHSFHSDGFASGKIQMLDFNIGISEKFVGKKLMDLDGFDDILIAAISREGNIIIPDGNTELQEFDLIYLIGRSEKIEELTHKFSDEALEKALERVMILGGSNIAFYLARDLVRHGIEVTIIEKELEVCNELSEKLDNVLIIHGDATDISLLEEEGLEHMDALIAVTGFDESNLLMGLMGKQLEIPKVISKVSRENYSKIIDRLDIDGAFNPIHIASSNILKIVRGGKVVSVSLLIGGEAEVTEIILSKRLNILNKTLEELRLPKGMIIGAILRDNEVIIPDGNTEFRPGDRIVVFSLKKHLKDLKKLFTPKKGGLLSGIWNSSKDPR